MITIQRHAFYNTLKAVAMFQCTDGTREHLCSVYFEADGKDLHVVATDGHTLAHATPTARVGGHFEFLMSSADVKDLLAVVKPARANAGHDLTISAGDALRITGPDVSFERAPMPGTFPPFRAIIPPRSGVGSKGAGLLGLNPEYLGRAAKAATAFAGGLGALREHLRTVGFVVSTKHNAKYVKPVRLDYTHPDVGGLTVIIMPMRIE